MYKNKTKKIIIFLIAIGLFATLNSVFAQNFGTAEVGTGLNNTLATGDPRETAGRIINIVLGLLGIIAVGIIMWAGFTWLTSNGEEEKINSAKTILRNGIIGLVIILASWGIANFVLNQLGGDGIGGGTNVSCTSGEVQNCQCGGLMSCKNGSWGECFGGSNCSDEDPEPVSCDSDPATPTCDAVNQICAAGDYCDNKDCSCKPKGGAGDSCNANTENINTCSADNNLCGDFLTCNTDTCTCYGLPVITKVSPLGGFCENDNSKSCTIDADCETTCNFNTPNGAPDNFITISGKSFGAYSATSSKVIFEGVNNPREGKQPTELNPACINSWKDNQIIIAVPSGVSTGPIKVINSDNLSDETNNEYGPKINDFQANGIVRPGLCSLSPQKGLLSDRVDYQGFNLYSGNAYFGNYQSNFQGMGAAFSNNLSGSTTIPNIRSGESSSFVISQINGNRQLSNALLFTKDREAGVGPYIISFWPPVDKAGPPQGNAGQYITIRGSGFGSAKGSSQVFFVNTEAPYSELEASYSFPDVCLGSVWKDNQIIVKVPPGLADSAYLIKIKLGAQTIDTSKINPSTFRNDKSLELLNSICKIEPSNGPVATPISIWGENFGNKNDNVLVKFNSDKTVTGTVEKEGKNNRTDLVKVNVPAQAISGPVKVIKNDQFGNEINFTVSSCTVNEDCGGTKVCCPSGTYREGRCFDNLDSCSSDVATSVYEWSFSTSFVNNDINIDPYYSCSGMAKKLDSCQVGATCPNSPGTCSPYVGGKEVVGKDCDYSCTSIAGCSTPGSCLYDKITNKCLKKDSSGSCSLVKKDFYRVAGQEKELTSVCNKDGRWELTTETSCPTYIISASGTPVSITLTAGTGRTCVDLKSTCSPCGGGLNCEAQSDGKNKCVSAELICPLGAECKKNNDDSGKGKCISKDEASCGCCCTIGQDTRDCCSYVTEDGAKGQLTCGGTCGADTGRTGTAADPITLGKCGGCAAAGDTAAERDAACNCSGHTGQYCDVSAATPQGVCSDCTGLSNKENCDDHSAACCFDANRTPDTTGVSDDFCRGGLAISSGEDKGYCAYFNCQSADSEPAGDPTLCASSTPFKFGVYSSVAKCTASSGCKTNPGNDDCSLADGKFLECNIKPNCCYNQKDSKCIGGTKIKVQNPKNRLDTRYDGYCAYFNCEADNNSCNQIATTTGAYMSTSTCVSKCRPSDGGGAGISCSGSNIISIAGQTDAAACAFNNCSLTGYACLGLTGKLGDLADCGTCCCTPANAATNTADSCKALSTTLTCQAGKGSCKGEGRGLCCGCSKDSECGSQGTTGCGADSCCEARPQLETTIPKHLATAVCRNSVVKVNFNQVMDVSSQDDIILLEEKNSGAICENGLAANSIDNIVNQQKISQLAVFYNNLKSFWNQTIGKINKKALAEVPDPKKNYCKVPGLVQSETIGNKSTLTFSPLNLLSPATNYYLVILGDENLDSTSGVMSIKGIGFNGEGYPDGNINLLIPKYTEGELITFNGKSYKNSRISKFTTLGGSTSICPIDHVVSGPSSYLFPTTANDINENDVNPQDIKNFDVATDKDKVFSAQAYSADGQVLQPVSGYFWVWKWTIENTQIATINPVFSAVSNKAFVSAQPGVVDGSTKLRASIDMTRFMGSGCTQGACKCLYDVCFNSCCNGSTVGNSLNATSDLFVFVCKNPWPPVAANGNWSPWKDNCLGSIDSNCSSFNYKFYYCRDAGDDTTLDDLPAIIDQAVTRGGNSTNLICSSDRSSCSSDGSACGAQGSNGICIWNVLKESYFFREVSPQGGQLISAEETTNGTGIKVTWRFDSAANVSSSIIYYHQSGDTSLQQQKVLNNATNCKINGQFTDCNYTISGLIVNTSYIFTVSLMSDKGTQSPVSGSKIIKTQDVTPPNIPTGLKAEIKNNKLIFTWLPNNDDTSSYILYHGSYSLSYGEKIPSNGKLNSLEFDVNSNQSLLGLGGHFLALSAVDANGNESGKSYEFSFIKNSCATAAKPKCANFDFFTNILTNVNFESATAEGLPLDWSRTQQQRSLVKTSQAVSLSGKQSVLLHRDAGYAYPGTCSQKHCSDLGACSGKTTDCCNWDSASKTCTFLTGDQNHPGATAVYKEGEELIWGNSNRVMWLSLAYSLANLSFQEGERYAINFYYKGKTISNVDVGLAAALGWPQYCVPYSYYGALKPGYSWVNGAIAPKPVAGLDPCGPGFGTSCANEPNTCCYQGPAQKKCYVGNSLPIINAGNYSDWTYYYHPFEYNSEMASWVDRTGKKMIEIGLSIGYASTLTGTDLYIDDFTVKKITSSAQVNN